MLEERLEIFIVTFKRSISLDKTLQQLQASPFSRCRITVLDNCSPDETPQVCEKYAALLPNFRAIRHKRNIGGNANYLRAVELSQSLYTWVLCDDDELHFEHASDVIAAINQERYDFIYVGSRSARYLNYQEWGACTVREVLEAGARYYRWFTFWPALIFKTDLYDNRSIHAGYSLIPYLYPHFYFIHMSVQQNFSVYLSERAVVERYEGNSSGFSGLFWYACWVTCCTLVIEDRKMRSKAIDEAIDRGFLKTVGFWIAIEKATGAKGFYKRLVDIAFALTMKQLWRFLLLLPLMIVPLPTSFLLSARKRIYKYMNIKDPPPVEIENR